MSEPPLLCLYMIVKDEAHNLAATLATVRPHIDCWHIVDTGSTDGTPDLVLRELADLPGALSFAPFVAFDVTRNVSLERAAASGATFLFWMSGDELLQDGAALRRFCAQEHDGSDGAYHVRMTAGDWLYDSARLSRAAAGWRFVGAIHEALVAPDGATPTRRAPGLVVLGESDMPRKMARINRDLDVLRRQVAADPDDPRARFYLAQSLFDLGRYADAEAEYTTRVGLGGWAEERAVAGHRRATSAELAGRPWPEVQSLLLAAHELDPTRPEPLRDLAMRAYTRGETASCYLFASRAADLPRRDASMFHEPNVVAQCADLAGVSAHLLGEHAASARYVRRALATWRFDPRLQANMLEARRHHAPSSPMLAPAAAPVVPWSPDAIVLATSLGPRDRARQQRAVRSWRAHGFAVLAINTEAEAATLRADFPEVVFVDPGRTAVRETGRHVPYVWDIARILEATGAEVVGIINSDIELRAEDALAPRVRAASRGGLVFASRRNVAHEDDADGPVEPWGADAFFFDRRLVAALDPYPFAIAEPWWDIWLPFAAAFAGLAVQRDMWVAWHLDHPRAWSDDKLASYAETFEAFMEARASPSVRAQLQADGSIGMQVTAGEWWDAFPSVGLPSVPIEASASSED